MTKDIQIAVAKNEISKGNVVSENFTALNFFEGEMDIISILKSDYIHELEIKVSRADFKKDCQKKKWKYFDNITTGRIPNYFSYVCPEGLIKLEELKPFMGLSYYKDGQIIQIRKPTLLHKSKKNMRDLYRKICTVSNWKIYYGKQQMTLINEAIYERYFGTHEMVQEKVKRVKDLIQKIKDDSLKVTVKRVSEYSLFTSGGTFSHALELKFVGQVIKGNYDTQANN